MSFPVERVCPREPGAEAGERRLDGPGPPALRLVHVGSEMVSLRWGGFTLRNTFWRVYCADRPGLSLSWAGGRIAYPTDRLTVIPGWLPFIFHPRLGVGHAYVHFDVPWLPRTLTEACFPDAFHLDDGALLERLRAMGRDLAWRRHDDTRIRLAAQAIASATMAAALDRLDPAARARCLPAGGGALAAVRAHVEDHLERPLAVADLARVAGQGVGAFHRAFRAELGQSPAQYVSERRVARAASSLVGGNQTLAAIASACGFPNRHYFTRVFTRRMGLPPATYRTLYRA
jgi:AraC-like DNA-binding protein